MSDTLSSRPLSAETRLQPSAQTERRRLVLDDRWLVTLLILVVLAISALPYLYAYSSSPPDMRFQGVLLNVPDTAQYFSWLRDHRSAWLVANRMTPEPNEPALFNLLWIVVGKIAAITGWSFAGLFQGLRLLAGAGLLLALYGFCRLFTHGRAERLTAYLVAALGAGLGWIWVVVKYLADLPELPFPRDIYTYEPNSFVIIMSFPHFTIATTLIVGVFGLYLLALRRRSWWYALAAALVALTLTLQHAYDLLIIGLVPAGALALMLLRGRRIPWFGGLALGLIGLISVPPAAYFTILTTSNPLWREVLAQFDNAGVFTPPPHHLLILIGIPLFITLGAIVWSIYNFFRRRGPVSQSPIRASWPIFHRLEQASDTDLFLWSWLLVGFGLLYVPTDFQIHMLTAWQIPTALIAARTLHRRIIPALATSRPRLAAALPALFLIAVLPTNIYYVAWRILDLGRHQAPYYLTVDEQASLEWLGATASHETVILSGLELGQYVPVYSDGRAFLSHWAQTVDFFGKRDAVAGFFAAETSDSERRELLDRFAVNFVIHGAEERALGSYDPATSPLFEPAFNSGAVTVYRVRSDQ